MAEWIGHDAAESLFLQAFQADRLHHAWLLAGPEGLGKAHFARAAAAHLLTRNPAHCSAHFDPDVEASGYRLLAEGHHPDCHVLTLEPRDDKEARKRERGEAYELARNIRIDQVRALQRRLTVRPSLAPRRVILFDSVDLLETGAANALLKSLEEPPRDTIFLLIAHQPGRLLPTIRSRCLSLRFAPLDDPAMARALRAAQPGLSDEEVAVLIRLGRGAPGRALAFAGLDMVAVERLCADIVRSGDRDQRQRLALGRLVAGKPQKERFHALLDYAPRFAASAIRRLEGRHQADAIAAWQDIRQLAARSVALNLDPASVAYQIGGLLARLAPPRA